MSETCARGCKVARRHAADCDGHDARGRDCRGCEPRRAEYGLLCYGCHKRLADMLKTAPGQVALLQTETVKVGSLAHPLKDDADSVPGPGDGPDAPYNLAAHDTIVLIGDILLAWVEMLCEDYRLRGPQVFDVQTGSTWLLAQLERLEYCDGIGDLWTELAEAMSQAHALAPWREEMQRIRGIPCPSCHRCNLALFGGDEDVTCLACGVMVPPARYAIWTRMLADDPDIVRSA